MSPRRVLAGVAGPSATPVRARLEPRLVIGLVLVAASIVGMLAVLLGVQQTRAVYAAQIPLAPGARVRVGDLAVVEVPAGEYIDRYLAADGVLPDELVVARFVDEGELIPRSAVGGPIDGDVAVVVPLRGSQPQGLTPGAPADIWVSGAQGADGAPTAPRRLVTGATFLREIRADAFSAGGALEGELRIPERDLPALLDALAADATVTLVPLVEGIVDER